MEAKEIIEGNKLIAEFMGWHYRKFEVSNLEQFQIRIRWYTLNDPDNLTGKGIIFQSSWDWLMPVVEKIESLGFWVKIFGFTSFDKCYKQCVIKKQKGDDYIYDYEGYWNISKIEAVWIAVVEFIKWYNDNKK